MVVPSGRAFLTHWIPIRPSPPVLFSTMKVRPRRWVRCSANILQSESPPPPAENGNTILVKGPDSPNALPALMDKDSPAHPAMKLRRFIPDPLNDLTYY